MLGKSVRLYAIELEEKKGGQKKGVKKRGQSYKKKGSVL